MATVREGYKKVLLVVDTQVGVLQNLWKAPQIIKNISIAVEKARHHNIPVIWVQHINSKLIQDNPEWQIVPELVPLEGEETRINKKFNSSFEQTSLEETLAQLGATHIVLAGAATNWCIRATAYAALDRGYDLTLLQDAHTTETMILENGIMIEAESIVQELNTVMNWLSYPGCTSRTISVKEFDFSVPSSE